MSWKISKPVNDLSYELNDGNMKLPICNYYIKVHIKCINKDFLELCYKKILKNIKTEKDKTEKKFFKKLKSDLKQQIFKPFTIIKQN